MQGKGEDIPTTIYVSAFKAKLKELFPPMDESQFIEELKKHKQKEEERVLELQKQIEKEEAKKKKVVKKDVKEESEVNYLIQKRPYYTRGWILIGFPNQEDQAREFELLLSGYVPDEELLNPEAEVRKKRAGVLAKVPDQPPAKNQFIEGGFDYVIKIQVPYEECIRRAEGRRLDPNTGNIYHLEDNPPPPNDVKLRDRLVPINDGESTS